MDNVNSKQVKIARRYAKALAKFNQRDKICAELDLVANTLMNSNDLKIFLENPLYSIQDKKDIIEQVFKNLSKDTVNFLLVLIEKNRFNCFDTVLSELKLEIDRLNNIVRVEVVSAINLEDNEKQLLMDCLGKKFQGIINADYSVDKSIIAGLVVKIGDFVIDNSLKTKFDRMKKQLIK